MDLFHPKEKLKLIDKSHPKISIKRQSELLNIARSTIYYRQRVNQEDKAIMDEIDEIYTDCPFYGKRRISNELKTRGFNVGIKRTKTLMVTMRIEPNQKQVSQMINTRNSLIYSEK